LLQDPIALLPTEDFTDAALIPVMVLTLMRRKFSLALPAIEAHFLVVPSAPSPFPFPHCSVVLLNPVYYEN
jgi:hypothetical protein